MPEVGTILPEREFRITRADLGRYAGAAGDFNPIHWSDRVAATIGLPGVIAHGMMTMALAGRLLTDWAGDPAAVIEYGVRFARPVVVSDDEEGVVLTVGGVVTEIRDDGLVGVEVSVRVGGEKVLTQARAVVRPPADG